jgi:hypothetical protein
MYAACQSDSQYRNFGEAVCLELPHVHAAVSLAWLPLPRVGRRVHIFKG